MDDIYRAGEAVLDQLRAAGFRAAFLPYHYISHIANTYEDLPSRSGKTAFIQDTVRFFREHQPPDIPFEPLSFLVVAFPGEASQVILNHKGKRVTVPIPPNYLDDTEETRKLNDILNQAAAGHRFADVRGMSNKLLAVYSGLGKYGRNNVCYVDDFGSYCNLKAYYTSIPCKDVIHPLSFLDSCESCGLCRDNCPTGAIGPDSVINAEKCLTWFNENRSPLPDWIPQDVHHSLIGCLRCQEICPHNKPITVSDRYTLELSESETEELLSSETGSLPDAIMQKLIQFGLGQFFTYVTGRNARLIVDKS